MEGWMVEGLDWRGGDVWGGGKWVVVIDTILRVGCVCMIPFGVGGLYCSRNLG